MITPEFKAAYARLNKAQKEAVDTIEGPVMVIAGPGTGKTTILTLRIANILIKTDTPPSGILALTFTEAGVKAMRMKLRGIIGSVADDVRIHTFHGFASSVIREFEDHFPHIARSEQISDIEAEGLIREILKNNGFQKLRPLGEPDFYVNKILGAIREAKQEAWTPEILAKFATEEIQRVKNDESSISTRGASKGSLKAEAVRRIEKSERTLILAKVYEAYERLKKEGRKIDFDDLIFELQRSLHEDKLLLQSLQEKFLYILLDEHQDTNDSQNLIVKIIADFFETPNLFVVGDEKQAIYRFQGASVENFLRFQKIWKEMKLIELTENFRSHQSILDASHSMIEKNYTEGELSNMRVKLSSKSERKAKPLDIMEAENIFAEENFLVQKLQALVKEEPESKVAVIVRRNSDVASILDLLEKNNIEAEAERGTNIFRHPVGHAFFSLINFLVDPSRTESLAETLAEGLWDLNFESCAIWIRKIRSGNLENIEEVLKNLPKIRSEIGMTSPIYYISLLSDLSGISDLASKTPLGAQVLQSIFALAKNLTIREKIDDPRRLLESLLAYEKSAEQKTVKISSGMMESHIIVLTAHSSKGLEFDHVFLPYATEESWVKKARGSYFVFPREKGDGDDLKDERRLFYVGITRAKHHVFITYSLEDESHRPLTPVRFLSELDQTHIKKEILPKTKPELKIMSKSAYENKNVKEKREYAKRILFERGLSVTALNQFVDCKMKFFYRSILGLPEAPNPSSEKGNAMHEALARVWKSKEKKKDAIEKILEESVEQYFKKSFLPIYEKETVLKELLGNAPIVAEALLDHFQIDGEVFTETWVEAPFVHKIENKDVTIQLHGKMDAILETQNDIFIFDYKTKEAMSENAIKGETQSEDGSYFRQLIFYKMLLEKSGRFNGKNIYPALTFVKPDNKGRCPTINIPINEADESRIEEEIRDLLEKVWSGEFLNQTCGDRDCKYCYFS